MFDSSDEQNLLASFVAPTKNTQNICHPSRKTSFFLPLCDCTFVQSGSHHLHPAPTVSAPVLKVVAVNIGKWKHWFIQHHCCWGWQQMCDWERAPGCKRKGSKRRNTEQNWSEGKQVSGSQSTESSTQLSGTNPVMQELWGKYSIAVIIFVFCLTHVRDELVIKPDKSSDWTQF